MSNPTFQTRQGLNAVCAGARFSGALTENTEEEYGGIEWLDVRPKPQWNDVESMGLGILRHRIAGNLNTRTSDMIQNDFKTALSPDTVVQSTFEWQFDMLNLWLIRDSGMIVFPYEVHVGMNIDVTSRYITVNTADELNQIHIEMFAHISACLTSGRTEKDKLQGMTKTSLEEYRDTR